MVRLPKSSQRQQLKQKTESKKLEKGFYKMGKYFGTDGVRGEANVELTPELAFKLGRFGGYVLSQHATEAPKVLLDVIHVFLGKC